MIVDREQIAWAAGLFEGEGFFAYQWVRQKHLRLSVGLAMTDEDVVKRFHTIVKRGVIREYTSPHKPHWKTHYRWTMGGFENVQYLVALFWPWLGERRRDRAKELLQAAHEYYAAPPVGVGRPRGSRNRQVVV